MSVNPDQGVYLGVVAETEVDPSLTLEEYKAAVQGNIPGAEWLEEKPCGRGVVLHSKENDEGLAIERLILLQLGQGTAVQVHLWGETELFHPHEAKLREVLTTFKL